MIARSGTSLRGATSLHVGTAVIIWMAAITLCDWWFPFDEANPGNRFGLQLLRLALAAGLGLYALVRFGWLVRLNVVRAQTLWLAVILLRTAAEGSAAGAHIMDLSHFGFWVIVLWACYGMAREGVLSRWQLAATGTVLAAFLTARLLLFQRLGVWVGATGSQDAATQAANSSYMLIWFILLILLETRYMLQWGVAIAASCTVILTLKRGALLALVVALAVYGVTWFNLHRRQRRNVVLTTGVLLVFLLIFAWAHLDAIAARWGDLGDPDRAGSGRLAFWAIIVEHWHKADWLTKIFGFGPGSVAQLLGSLWRASIPAHSDWLEMLHDFGICGVIALGLVCAGLVSEAVRSLRRHLESAPVLCAAVVVLLISSVYSMVSFQSSTAWFSLLFASGLSSCPGTRDSDISAHTISATRRVCPSGHANRRPRITHY